MGSAKAESSGKNCLQLSAFFLIFTTEDYLTLMNSTINKGGFDTDRLWAIMLGTLTLVLLTVLASREIFSGKYYKLDLLIISGILFILFTCLLFKSLSNYKAITIYENTLGVRWLFGLIRATIKKEDITQFGRNTFKKSDHIYIKTNKYTFLLEEKITENNELIIDQLRSWQVKRKDNIVLSDRSHLEQKAAGIILMAFSILLLTRLIFSLTSPPSITNETTFHTVSGHLQHKPEIIKPKGKSSVKDVIFYLHEYPGFKFTAGYPGYTLMNHESLSAFNRADLITFLITQDKYEKMIVKSIETDYFENHLNWSDIAVYDVEIENKKMLSLEDYKNFLEENKGIHPATFVIFVASCIGLFIYGVKEFLNTNPHSR